MNLPKIFLSHSGKQHSYHVAKAMEILGFLEVFFTSSYIKSKKIQNFFIKRNNTFFTRRFIIGLHGNKVNSNWRFEVKEQVLRKLFGKKRISQNSVYQRDILFDKFVAKKLRKSTSTIFWGFQGSCFESIIAANFLNKISVCELATAHVSEAKKILSEEQLLHPEWADSIDNLIFPEEYEQRLLQEPHLAKYVVAASEFTRQSLLNDGIEAAKILYLPLGFDLEHIPYNPRNKEINKLKILYAGTVTQRKGIKYLLEAIKVIDNQNVELHIIGGIQGSGNALKQYSDYFIYHPPVSQMELYQLYSQFDILVLPTIFEGFGLVIVEALAAGLPVITTSHSFGAEIIKDNINGMLVPIRSVDALVKAISYFLAIDSLTFSQLQINSQISVNQLSWGNYQNNLFNLIRKITNGN